MNFVQQLMAGSAVAPLVQPRKKRVTESTYAGRKAKTRGRYRLYLENTVLSTPQIASKLGLTPAGCLSSLYDLEADEWIKRVGRGTPTGLGKGKKPVLWTWNNEKKEAVS